MSRVWLMGRLFVLVLGARLSRQLFAAGVGHPLGGGGDGSGGFGVRFHLFPVGNKGAAAKPVTPVGTGEGEIGTQEDDQSHCGRVDQGNDYPDNEARSR